MFKNWIALSTGYITIKWISITTTNATVSLIDILSEKSLSYCRNIFRVPVPGVISKPLVEFTGLLPRDPVPEPGDEAFSDSYDPWGDDNMLVGLL